MINLYLGVDNGATGSVGILLGSTGDFFPTPVKQVPNYTKEVQMIGRIDLPVFKKKIMEYYPTNSEYTIRCLIERPFMAPVTTIDYTEFIKEEKKDDNSLFVDNKWMDRIDLKKKVPTVNMVFLKSSLNAQRAFEATIILMESMKIGYEVIDSKAWQKEMLGNGISGSKNLKEASKLKGIQMFPYLEEVIKKHHDADGLMIATYCQRYYQQ